MLNNSTEMSAKFVGLHSLKIHGFVLFIQLILMNSFISFYTDLSLTVNKVKFPKSILVKNNSGPP